MELDGVVIMLIIFSIIVDLFNQMFHYIPCPDFNLFMASCMSICSHRSFVHSL